jgi:anti-anti-sigma factor
MGRRAMAITVRRERGQRRIVVVITGALDAGAVPSLRRALVKALRTRAPILIDLTEATSIHRDGFALLVAAYREGLRTGQPLLLRTEPTQIRDILGALGIPPEDQR